MASSEVLALTTIKARIWKHFHDIFVGSPIGLFYKWKPLPGGTVTESDAIVPNSFSANVTSKAFGESENRRALMRELEFQTWQVIVTFPASAEDIITDRFDEALCNVENLIIPRGTDENGDRIPQLFPTIVAIDYSLPPTHAPSSGTVVRYTFQVLQGRN